MNGSGKTTTFEMLAGITTPSAGSIYIQGFDVQADLARARRFIGYCSGPQEDRIYPTLTVQEHLFLFGSIKGVRGKELADAVEALMERLLLSEYRHRFAGKLSRGNVRKLLVGIALIGQPPLIFLDEPSTGMDAFARRFMCEVVQDIAYVRKESVVVLSTHSMEECEALCSCIAILVGGQFSCLGSAQALKETYATGFEVQATFVPVDESATARQVDLWSRGATSVTRTTLWAKSECLDVLDAAQASRACGAGGLLAVQDKVAMESLAQWVVLDNRVQGLLEALVGAFPGGGAFLVEHHGEVARVRLPSLRSAALAELFRTLRRVQASAGVQDFAVTQSTLEQIFNSLAKAPSQAADERVQQPCLSQD